MRHTRKGVIARTRREFAMIDRLVARLRPADWKRHVPRAPERDPWTVKDVLAHVTYWKAQAEVLRTLASTPEAWFRRRDRSPEWPADFDGHSAAHRVKDIEAALGRGSRRSRG
jgi:hypothetical protein